MKTKKIIASILFVFTANLSVAAQTDDVEQMRLTQIDTNQIDSLRPEHLHFEAEKVIDLYNKQSNFGMYKDNYFITGVPINKAINSQTADAKFQISIRQRLFNRVMPFNTQLLLTYTQKSFWDIYDDSAPFADNNYNPGLLLMRPIIDKNHLKGMLALSVEHESNGKDKLESRSWNYFTLSGIYFFNVHFYAQAKVWYGWVGEDNSDLFDYRGYGFLALNYRNKNDRIAASLILNPINNFSVNTQLEVSYKINKRANQFLFLQWSQGYGESLLDYNKYTSMVRMGICIKPQLRNLY